MSGCIWVFLFHANTVISSSSSLPKRGEKDFQPEGTKLQSQVLEESRAAMYTALQGSRGHSGKQRVTARWYPDLGQARVDPPARGLHFLTIGKADSRGDMWLAREELVYLVERGSLECYWQHDNGEPGPPMSLQAVYAAVYGDASRNVCEIERYQVYSYLKRLGFIVQRAPSYDDGYKPVTVTRRERPQVSIGTQLAAIQTSLLEFVKSTRMFGLLAQYYYPAAKYLNQQPLFQKTVGYGSILYRNAACMVERVVSLQSQKVFHSYREIYQDLDFVPTNKPPKTQAAKVSGAASPEAPFRVVFHVWKPRPNFSKKAPGTPDFFICVVSTHEFRVPSLQQTMALLDQVNVKGFTPRPPKNAPPKNPRDQRLTVPQQTNLLKHGYRSVIIAAVDSGIINMTAVGDVPFGQEAVYYPYK